MTKQKKLVNKRLIKFLMDVRRVEMISITSTLSSFRYRQNLPLKWAISCLLK